MSLKILCVGDIHLRASAPVSRLDKDFLGTIIEKLEQIADMSDRFDMVILLGDVFDRPDVVHSVVIRAMRVFSMFKTPVYSVVGNHDVPGYQGADLTKSALGVLFESGVVKKLDSMHINNVSIYGLHAYDKTLWTVPDSGSVKILVAHKMVTNNPFPDPDGRNSCHVIADVSKLTNADLILSGDIHYPHEVEIDNKLFLNPGSLARLSIADRDRHPQVAEITIEDSGEINHNFLALNSKPAEMLFDLKNYSQRMAAEAHTKGFVKTYAQVVLSVKAEAHLLAPALERFLAANGVEAKLHTSVLEYYDRAEKEVLAEIKD